MSDLLTKLASYEINVANRIRAIQSIRELGFDEESYRTMILDLTGREVDGDEFVIENTFKYLVDEVMVDGKCDFDVALKKATSFVDLNPWVKVKPDYTSYYTPKSTVDAMGNPKQKKGKKKDQAIKLWKERKDENLSRQQWIEILMDKVGLSKMGASTYHYNLSKGIYK